MRAAASVLGSGELGRACALALAANGHPAVDLLTRDVTLAREEGGGVVSTKGAAAASPVSAAWPAVIRLRSAVLDGRDGCATAPQLPLFVCTPATSYLAPDDAWAKAALGNENAPVTHGVLQHCSSAPRNTSGHRQQPFVSVFTRGFTADGAVPAQIADALLNNVNVSSAHTPGSERGGGGCIPVLVAAGPIVAKEWAQQSTPVPSSESQESRSVPLPSSSIPPRPRSALSNDRVGDQAATDKPRSHAVAAHSPSSSFPHAYSGVALSFATWTPSVHADAGRQAALAQQVTELFPRESVTFLPEPDAAAVLAIVNGCVPLCAFGAGLVSHVYTGTSVSSLAAYAQHATHATEQLVNGLLGRRAGTPLPIAAWSTLNCACTCFASREFALGRQLEFYFRKQDAAEAIFRGRTHHVFAATVDGLHTRMQQCGVAQPFYEVLMDTYNTMIRASRAGEGLVKDGFYGYRECTAGEDSLLQHATHVDEAMLSGDEAQFTAAKERIMRAFPDAVIR